MPDRPKIEKRVLIDVIVEPCGCNLLVWSEPAGDGWELHCGPCCEDCEKTFIAAVRDGLGRLPWVRFVWI